jgi:hypothetical protein
MPIKRRNFLRQSFASAAGIAASAMFPEDLFGRGIHNTSRPEEIVLKPEIRTKPKDSIRFSVIGINHSHIYGMVSSLIGGGGELIMVYAREPDLLKTFTKTFPGVKVARSEEEILEDNTIRLVASASIPVDRAPLGIKVMEAGKDFMTDKPGIVNFDQFLFYTGSKQAEVNFAQVGNFNMPDHPGFMDFGDMSVRSLHASGYIRIDWFTPDSLATWGDGRTFNLGTDGYIETRKYIDITGREGGNHLFLVNQKETKYYNCSNIYTPYGEQLISDVVNRTETAMTQDHCFLATELALTAQKMAHKLNV